MARVGFTRAANDGSGFVELGAVVIYGRSYTLRKARGRGQLFYRTMEGCWEVESLAHFDTRVIDVSGAIPANRRMLAAAQAVTSVHQEHHLRFPYLGEVC